jgi:tRNA modification GTPase
MMNNRGDFQRSDQPNPTDEDQLWTSDDTICAIATPVGQGGIGIIRISGPRSHEIASRIFKPAKPSRALKSHYLYLGQLYDPKAQIAIDEVLLTYMPAPHSYTREDVIEINSHSGYLLLARILEIVIHQGARLARPGEFTLRAFLNGRIDLTQSEAVIDLINAQSERGLDLASQQIQGAFKERIYALRQRGLDILAHLEVAIDFPEEEEGMVPREESCQQIEQELLNPIRGLIEIQASQRIWIEGVKTVIIGRVNVGKSSLLNSLLNEERAIVTPIPGTTRDVIDAVVTIQGLPLRLMDTAGFRKVNNEVEQIGVQLTAEKIIEADLLLVVIDQSSPVSREDLEIVSRCREKKCLAIINKIDLPARISRKEAEEMFSTGPIVRISALTGEGLPELKKAIAKFLLAGDLDMTTSHVAPNLRHRQALKDAARFFKNAADCLNKGNPIEIVAFELKAGLDSLGEITGETAGADILDRIFSRFCLGK